MKHRSLVVLSIVVLMATVVFSAALIAQQRSGQPAGAQATTPAPARAAQPATAPAAKAAAPTQAAAAKKYVAPRTPDGKADLQGYWGNATITPLTRRGGVTKEFYTDAEFDALLKQGAARDAEQTTPGTDADVHYDFTQFGLDTSQSPIVRNLRTSLIIDPPDGQLPARVGAAPGGGGAAGGGGGAGGARGGRGAGGGAPAAAAPAGGRGAGAGGGAQAAAAPAGGRGAAGGGGGRGGAQYDSILSFSAGTRCIIAGGSGPPLQDAGYNSVYQIVQSPGYVTIITEMNHDARVIPIDSRPLPPEQVKQWIGFSRGHWEGDTLVVETTNFNGRRQYQGAGVNMRITEKFTRIAEDRIDYTFTVQDETVWVRPWTASAPLTKEKGPMFEFACHETNYGPANILAGARAEEKKAAEAAGQK